MSTETNSLDFTNRLLSRHRDSASPLLTWYGQPGERVELSGHVFDNWVAKSANLLAEEFDTGPGSCVLIDLPAHWKSLAIGFAVLSTGAEIRVVPAQDGGAPAPGDAAPDLVVTGEPVAAAGAFPQAEILAVALGSLALSFPGELPAGALDYVGEVRGFGDYYLADPVPATGVALGHPDGSGELSYAELFGLEAGEGTALLGPGSAFAAALRAAVSQWRGASPLVLLGAEAPVTQRILDDERVAHRL
ncbi:TIGR03089 family protein [Arthrobacter sp. JSM 101049]|uniref:TIGR03089 family protein n=1 Tax=Arthrobacter sp. JSM 101049 TaxID=929097 RepID=UPI003567886A